MIPKHIHQCWVTANLDTERQNTVNSLRNLNKGWQHTLWDEPSIQRWIKHAYGQDMLAVYLSINPRYGAARADLFRYLKMYTDGGVYFDVKSMYLRPLDKFVKPNDALILTGSHKDWHNWHIMCVPRHPYLFETIDRVLFNIKHYDPARDGVGKIAALMMTGPRPYTIAVNSLFTMGLHRVASPFPASLCYDMIGSETRMADPNHYSNQTEPLILR